MLFQTFAAQVTTFLSSILRQKNEIINKTANIIDKNCSHFI